MIIIGDVKLHFSNHLENVEFYMSTNLDFQSTFEQFGSVQVHFKWSFEIGAMFLLRRFPLGNCMALLSCSCHLYLHVAKVDLFSVDNLDDGVKSSQWNFRKWHFLRLNTLKLISRIFSWVAEYVLRFTCWKKLQKTRKRSYNFS